MSDIGPEVGTESLAIPDFTGVDPSEIAYAFARLRLGLQAEQSRVVALEEQLELERTKNAVLAAQNSVQAEQLGKARIDYVTGLPNRAWFEERLTAEYMRARRAQESFESDLSANLAVLFGDIDGLKETNGEEGTEGKGKHYDRGDKLLYVVSRSIEKVLRPGDFLARHGGDEFGGTLPRFDGKPGEDQPSIVQEKVEDIQGTVDEELEKEGFDTSVVGLSLAIVVLKPGEEKNSLMSRAQTAMVKNKKERGRGR